jgi:hypothetical protein
VRTFPDVGSVARDADWRTRRITLFFEALFAVAVVGLFAIDRIPPRPRLECRVHRAQTESHYPHPYGEPPPVEWTTCVWR